MAFLAHFQFHNALLDHLKHVELPMKQKFNSLILMGIISHYSTFITLSNSHVIRHNGVTKISSIIVRLWGTFLQKKIEKIFEKIPENCHMTKIKFSVLIMSDNNCHVSWTDLLCREEVLNSLPKSTIQILEKLLFLDSLCRSPTRFVISYLQRWTIWKCRNLGNPYVKQNSPSLYPWPHLTSIGLV